MSDYDDTNRGVLFKNDKQGVENRPDYKGHINVDGVEMWLDAWIKTPKNGGSKFMSVSVSPKVEKPQPEEPEAVAVDDSDVPF